MGASSHGSGTRLHERHGRRAASSRLLFVAFVIWARADQIITGTALTLLSVGATGTLYRAVYGSCGAALDAFPPAPRFRSPASQVYRSSVQRSFPSRRSPTSCISLAPALAWWLARTHAGLALRAIGDRPDAAEAAGIAVDEVREHWPSSSAERLAALPGNARPRPGWNVRRGNVRRPRVHRDRHRGARAVDTASAWSVARCCSAQRVPCSSPFRRWGGTRRIRFFSPCRIYSRSPRSRGRWGAHGRLPLWAGAGAASMIRDFDAFSEISRRTWPDSLVQRATHCRGPVRSISA